MSSRSFRAVLVAAGLALVGSTAVYAHEAAVDVEAEKRAIRIADDIGTPASPRKP